MKTPEEIKKGLECCSTKKPCPSCPMWDECKEAASLKPLWDNALAYIKQLEEDNAGLLTKVEQLEAKCHQLERERNAAVDDLKSLHTCETCRHEILEGRPRKYTCQIEDFVCDECSAKGCPCMLCRHGSNWEWRGVKEDIDND